MNLLANSRQAALPAAILLLVVVMVVPIPAFLLDIFFVANIAISLAVLMVALNAEKPLDFSAFPTVLLFATPSPWSTRTPNSFSRVCRNEMTWN